MNRHEVAVSIGIICGQLVLIGLGLFTDRLPPAALGILVTLPMFGIALMAANAARRESKR